MTSPKVRRWLWIPFAFLVLSIYLVGFRAYQHRKAIQEPPATVLTEEQLLYIEVMDGETININTADVRELMRLPGIGEVIAKRIYDTRQTQGDFSSPEEVKEIKGVGEKLYQKIEDYIVLE